MFLPQPEALVEVLHVRTCLILYFYTYLYNHMNTCPSLPALDKTVAMLLCYIHWSIILEFYYIKNYHKCKKFDHHNTYMFSKKNDFKLSFSLFRLLLPGQLHHIPVNSLPDRRLLPPQYPVTLPVPLPGRHLQQQDSCWRRLWLHALYRYVMLSYDLIHVALST